MTNILFFIAGIALGYWIGARDADGAEARKKENKEEVIELLKGADDGKITNDYVEKALKVSNTTAGRYLDELEKEGKIKQVGETGRGVYYTFK